jgi:hypothetical protein
MEKVERIDCRVIARDNGEVVNAKVFVCPNCGFDEGNEPPVTPPLFTVFEVAGHVHLQCLYCEETFCSGEGCEPLKKKIIVVPG